MSRELRGLKWARALTAQPRQIPTSRPRGVKAKGKAYEAALARSLPRALHGQWYEFEDSNGPGWCQLDFLLLRSQRLVVLEAKLTWTPGAFRQLDRLYLPVVEAVYGGRPVGLQVCRNLVPGLTSVVVGDLERGIQQAASGREVCWHWLGAEVRPRWRGDRAGHRKELERVAALL